MSNIGTTLRDWLNARAGGVVERLNTAGAPADPVSIEAARLRAEWAKDKKKPAPVVPQNSPLPLVPGGMVSINIPSGSSVQQAIQPINSHANQLNINPYGQNLGQIAQQQQLANQAIQQAQAHIFATQFTPGLSQQGGVIGANGGGNGTGWYGARIMSTTSSYSGPEAYYVPHMQPSPEFMKLYESERERAIAALYVEET